MDFFDILKSAAEAGNSGGGGGGGGGCPANNVMISTLVVDAPTAEVAHAQTDPPETA